MPPLLLTVILSACLRLFDVFASYSIPNIQELHCEMWKQACQHGRGVPCSATSLCTKCSLFAVFSWHRFKNICRNFRMALSGSFYVSPAATDAVQRANKKWGLNMKAWGAISRFWNAVLTKIAAG